MNEQVLVRVEGLSKRYWLYQRHLEKLQQAILAPVTRRDYAHPFWALRGVSLELQRGEVLGVIGVNGSGKSTLLQVVAGILQPTLGSVAVHGRVTALLELGAGFHPEFTGRENILISGATLGIARQEMSRRMQQIIDFAQIGQFIDQPVKLYSSGMYVRLAFAIATSVEPDILVIDEALAVGDAGFVIKCMNRMKELKDGGAAILLVSHDIQTVRTFCDRVLWLAEGEGRMLGAPLDVTSQYIQYLLNQDRFREFQVETTGEAAGESRAATPAGLVSFEGRADLVRWGNGALRIEGFNLFVDGQSQGWIVEHGQTMSVRVVMRALEEIPQQEVGVGICFRNLKGLDVITSTTYDQDYRFPAMHKGQAVSIQFELENILAPGDYALVLNIEDRASFPPGYFDFIENAAILKVVADKMIFSTVLPPVKQRIEFLS